MINRSKPRVTEIIRAVGLSKSYDGIDPFYRERGTAVHRAVQLELEGTLDEATLDEVCVPYLEGFRKFWKELGAKAFATEQHMENDDFHGTIDLIADGVIYDYKCSKSHDRAAEVQGCGYKKLANNDKPFRVVQLPGDGSYRIFEYNSPVYLWDSVWQVYKWKMKL